jgi:hypothetical protein
MASSVSSPVDLPADPGLSGGSNTVVRPLMEANSNRLVERHMKYLVEKTDMKIFDIERQDDTIIVTPLQDLNELEFQRIEGGWNDSTTSK